MLINYWYVFLIILAPSCLETFFVIHFLTSIDSASVSVTVSAEAVLE